MGSCWSGLQWARYVERKLVLISDLKNLGGLGGSGEVSGAKTGDNVREPRHLSHSETECD